MSGENKEQKAIDEKTPITIGLVVTLAAGIYFISGLKFQASANEKEIVDLKKKITVIQRIDTRLSRIEGALKIEAPKDEQ